MFIRLLTNVVLLLLLGSCSAEDRPKDVLDGTTFAKIYCALEEAGRKAGGATINGVPGFNPDTTFLRFKVSRREFDRTVRYYNEDLQRWRDFYTDVVSIQDGDKSKAAPRPR